MVQDATLVVRPNRDSPENGGSEGPMAYGEVWLQSVLSSLAWRGGLRRELHGNDAVGNKFEAATTSLNPSLVVGVGHGNADTWVGQYVEGEGYSVILTTTNAGLMAGRVVYLLSCLTAQELGPDMVRKGAVAYAGYSKEFIWTVSDPSRPATDRLAASFGKVSTIFPKVLIGGRVVREAKVKAIETFDREIERWENSTDPYAREVVKWLLWDRDALTVLGNEEAKGLEPKLAIGLVVSGVAAASAIGAFLYIRRRRK